MAKHLRKVCAVILAALLLSAVAIFPAAGAEAWLYRDCPNGKDMTAGSTRSGGTETYHAYYQNGSGPYTLVKRTGAIAISGTYLNYSDVHFLTDGRFLSLTTGCA